MKETESAKSDPESESVPKEPKNDIETPVPQPSDSKKNKVWWKDGHYWGCVATVILILLIIGASVNFSVKRARLQVLNGNY